MTLWSRRTRRPARSGVLVLALPVLALAANGVPAALRGAIMAKALGYEKRSQTGKGTLVLGVVGPSSGQGASDAQKMERTFSQVARRGIAGRSASVVRMTEIDPSAAASKLKSHGATVAYIASGMGTTGLSLAATFSEAVVERRRACSSDRRVLP